MNLDSSAYSTSTGLSHSVLPKQSSMPTALAPSKLFHEIHPVQLARNATRATALGHMYYPRSRKCTSNGNRPYTESGVWYTPLCGQWPTDLVKLSV